MLIDDWWWHPQETLFFFHLIGTPPTKKPSSNKPVVYSSWLSIIINQPASEPFSSINELLNIKNAFAEKPPIITTIKHQLTNNISLLGYCRSLCPMIHYMVRYWIWLLIASLWFLLVTHYSAIMIAYVQTIWLLCDDSYGYPWYSNHSRPNIWPMTYVLIININHRS